MCESYSAEMAESRKQWHLVCRHFRNNISNIWIHLGFRLDFRLRVYMLKEPLRVLYNFLDINICSYEHTSQYMN